MRRNSKIIRHEERAELRQIGKREDDPLPATSHSLSLSLILYKSTETLSLGVASILSVSRSSAWNRVEAVDRACSVSSRLPPRRAQSSSCFAEKTAAAAGKTNTTGSSFFFFFFFILFYSYSFSRFYVILVLDVDIWQKMNEEKGKRER